jgi:hypothetical protein
MNCHACCHCDAFFYICLGQGDFQLFLYKLQLLGDSVAYSSFLRSHVPWVVTFDADVCIFRDRRNLGGGGGQRGQVPPPHYFFNLGIIYLVTELNNGR